MNRRQRKQNPVNKDLSAALRQKALAAGSFISLASQATAQTPVQQTGLPGPWPLGVALLCGGCLGLAIYSAWLRRKLCRITEKKSSLPDGKNPERRRYHDLVETTTDLVVICDVNGRITSANPAAQQMLGYTLAELTGLSVERLVAPEHQRVIAASLAAPMAEVETVTGELEVLTKSGKRLWLEVNAQLLRSNGHPSGAQAIGRDITKRKQAELELDQSRRNYQTLAEVAPVGIFRTDAAGKTVYVNPCWQQLAQMEASAALGDGWLARVHPDDCAGLAEGWSRAAKNQSPSRAEYRFVRPDGSTIWVEGRATPEKDESGQVVGYLGTVTDITERKQNEQDMAQSESRYRELFEHNPAPMFIYERGSMRLLAVNEAFIEVYGYSREDALKLILTDLYPPEQRDKMTEFAARVQGHANAGEWQHVRHDGSRFDVVTTSHGMPFLGRNCRIAVVTDISDRRNMERELQRSRAETQAMLDASPDVVVMMDLNGQFLSFNQAVLSRLNLSREALLHHPGSDFLSPRVFQTIMGHIQQLVDSREAIFFTDQLEGRFYENALVPVKAEDGSVRNAVLFSRDVTERMQAEEEKQRLQGQLLQAQKMESVGRLAGGVAHDFNNMLQTIIGNIELAMNLVPAGGDVSDYLAQATRAAESSATLTRQLLAFARKQTVAPKVLDLNAAVSGIFKMLSRLIGENIELVWKPGANLWPVKIDPAQIDQILANLCVNARDAIDQVGRVVIDTESISLSEEFCAAHEGASAGDYVMLTVSDDGCGMDAETLAHIFEPFFTTKEIGQGTGLGLATVYGVVKQNNGFLSVYSELGKGTTFKVFFPRHLGSASDTHPPNQEVVLEQGHGERVLVVEDEMEILRLTKSMLQKLGYTVLCANSPRDALDLIERDNKAIDLLITDVVMPEMNGRELATRIRELRPGVPCLFMSGYTADAIAHQGVLDDDVLFLPKPFSMRQLASQVRAALDPPRKR